MRAPRPCTKPGCRKLTDGTSSRCDLHPYEKKRRTSSGYKYLYDSKQWRVLRRNHLKANPWCVVCGRLATVVDHKTVHRGDAKLFYDPNNLQSMCKRDHDAKTAREDGGFGNKRKQG